MTTIDTDTEKAIAFHLGHPENTLLCCWCEQPRLGHRFPCWDRGAEVAR